MSKKLRIFMMGGMGVRARTPARARRAFIEKGFSSCAVRCLMREMKTGDDLVRRLSYFLEERRDAF